MSLSLSSGNPFYPGAALVAECLKAFLPPEPSNVADYAAAHRWLSNEGGGYIGRWNHDQAPYLVAPMEALSDDAYSAVAVVGPGQTGKTEIARNWLFTSALSDPADMLWYSSSEPLVAGEVKKNISRMVNDQPALGELLSRDSLAFKKFGSMSVEFLAGISGNLISKSAPRIVADEFDAICETVPNAKELMDVRRRTFGNRSKLLALSHPDAVEGLETRDWNAGIMELFRDSNRHLWGWECPECGAWSSPNPTAKRVMVIHYDDKAPLDEIRDMARLLCPVNGCLIEDSRRYAMNLTGKWYGLGQELEQDGTVAAALVSREIAGFWIVGAMSTLGTGGIGELAEIKARAERKYAIDGNRKAYRSTISKNTGETLKRETRAETIDATVLAERAEAGLVLGTVANGVRFITVMIDVQGNRFELMARGWCEGGRSVVVDFRRIEASPNTSAADWDDLLAFATSYAWPLEGRPGRGMRATVVGFDSAGKDGVTLQAYQAWRRLKASRGTRLLGRIDGRPVWACLPMKGASTLQAPRLQVVFPDAARADRLAQARGEVPVALFNPNTFKDDLNGQLILADDAAWSVRFPKGLANDQAPHLWFEQLVAENRERNGRWKPRQDGRPNEALDLMVGTHVLAFLLGVARMRWDAAPSWARPWDENVNVVAMTPRETVKAGAHDGAGAVRHAPAPISRMAAALSAVAAAARPGTARIVDSVKVRR